MGFLGSQRGGSRFGALLVVTALVAGLLLAGVSALILFFAAIGEAHPTTVGWVTLCVMVVFGVGVVVAATRLRS